ncbi:MAG: hypothetical protein DDT27_01106 [Dehalococcoidia bacterium]|nr:hypothetical protein [Chloroflexota bacterium]
MEELKNRVMIRLIDELIETLEQIKYDQRLYLGDQIKKLVLMKQDIEREDLN